MVINNKYIIYINKMNINDILTTIETPKIHMKLEDITNNALDNQYNPEKSEHKWRFHKARLIPHSTVMFARWHQTAL